MLTSELITLAQNHLRYDLDAYMGQTPEDTEWVTVLNWAQRAVAKKIEPYDPAVVFTLTANTGTYNLRDLTAFTKKIHRVERVMINGNMLYTRSRQDVGLWSLGELQQFEQTWVTDPAGTPTKAVQYDTKLILHSKPDGAYGNNYIAGIVFPADLTDPAVANASPDLPEETHEALALMAAIYAADPNVSESEGLGRLGRYNQRVHDTLRQVQLDFADSRSAFGGSADSYTPRFMQI